MDNVYLRLGEMKQLPKEILENPELIRMLRRINANPDKKMDLNNLVEVLDLVSSLDQKDISQIKNAVDDMDYKAQKRFL